MTHTEILSKEKRNKWILISAILALSTFFMTLVFGSGQGTHLSGEVATYEETKIATLKVVFINIPILGFILGVVFNLIPYKKAPYHKKFLRTSLLIILILEIITCSIAVLGSLYQMVLA